MILFLIMKFVIRLLLKELKDRVNYIFIPIGLNFKNNISITAYSV